MEQRKNTLGAIVREARKEKELSQEALAERIRVCKRTIIDIEKDTGNPKFEMLCALVRELELPLYRIFYPEATENLETKNMILQELSGCSMQEMKIILAMVRCLRAALKEDD